MPKESGRYLVGCDIGGTLTDLVLFDQATGEMIVNKVVTTLEDPSEAVVNGVCSLARSVPDYPRHTRQSYRINGDTGELTPLETYPVGQRPMGVLVTSLED